MFKYQRRGESHLGKFTLRGESHLGNFTLVLKLPTLKSSFICLTALQACLVLGLSSEHTERCQHFSQTTEVCPQADP